MWGNGPLGGLSCIKGGEKRGGEEEEWVKVAKN